MRFFPIHYNVVWRPNDDQVNCSVTKVTIGPYISFWFAERKRKWLTIHRSYENECTGVWNVEID